MREKTKKPGRVSDGRSVTDVAEFLSLICLH